MSTAGKILIIKAGSKLASLAAVEGDFEHWMMAATGRKVDEFNVISVADGQTLPEPEKVSAIIITGSGAMVTDKSDWIEQTSLWLRALSQESIPILGICFGHQLLAYALGGTVADNPKGVEVGTVDLQLMKTARDDGLFAGLGNMRVQASHRQCVIQLPETAVRLASTAMDVNHAFRFQDHIWGVQFHPEFNAEITRHYVRYYQHELERAGIDCDVILQSCQDTPMARGLLQLFLKQAGN